MGIVWSLEVTLYQRNLSSASCKCISEAFQTYHRWPVSSRLLINVEDTNCEEMQYATE